MTDNGDGGVTVMVVVVVAATMMTATDFGENCDERAVRCNTAKWLIDKNGNMMMMNGEFGLFVKQFRTGL